MGCEVTDVFEGFGDVCIMTEWVAGGLLTGRAAAI